MRRVEIIIGIKIPATILKTVRLVVWVAAGHGLVLRRMEPLALIKMVKGNPKGILVIFYVSEV